MVFRKLVNGGYKPHLPEPSCMLRTIYMNYIITYIYILYMYITTTMFTCVLYEFFICTNDKSYLTNIKLYIYVIDHDIHP